MAARDQVMSSTERAPEPTMEEILASIRRIISEDETGGARQQRPTAQGRPDDEGLDGGEDEPDNEIINDIARVLSNSGASQEETQETAAPEATEEEEILDLTAELGGLEIVEDETEELELVEVVEEVEEEAPIELFNPAPARSAQVAAPAEAEEEPEPELELVEEVTEIEDEPAAEASASEPEPAPAPAEVALAATPAPRQMSASEEAASALERAIAALRAGQVPMSPTFSFQPQPEPVFTPPGQAFQSAPEPAQAAQPAPSAGFAAPYEPVSIPEPVPAPEPVAAASAPSPEPVAEAEPELVLTEIESEGAEPVLAVETVTSEPESHRAWEASPAPSGWTAKPELETPAPQLNGGSHAPHTSGGSKTLEDSVKDMLRPMLQKWLDENMTRVLTAALKDELRENPARLRGE